MDESCSCGPDALFIETEFGMECQTCGNYKEVDDSEEDDDVVIDE